MIEIFSIIGAISFSLLGVGYLKTQPKAKHAQIYFGLSICIVFYFLNALSFVWVDPSFRIDIGIFNFILNWLPSLAPSLFMLFCFCLFEESKKLPRWLVVIVGGHFLIYGGWLIYSIFVDYRLLNTLAAIFLSRLLDMGLLVFALGSVFWTLKEWRNDLEEKRRGLRRVFIFLQGVIILIVVVSENYIAKTDETFKLSQQISVSLVATSGFIVVLVLMTFDLNVASRLLRVAATPTPIHKNSSNTSAKEFEDFERIFIEQKLYRQHDLTIARVAKALGLPEYRARKLIIESLGFRNFNTMLNHYRVNDACEFLADPAKKDMPILTIALEVGYNSINPFNVSFRALKGVSPSEYRQNIQKPSN